jgi:hypothetical protein
MTWNAHINNITSKAQKLLGFLRRNLQIKNEHIKDMAYKSLVKSNLEYCSTISVEEVHDWSIQNTVISKETSL